VCHVRARVVYSSLQWMHRDMSAGISFTIQGAATLHAASVNASNADGQQLAHALLVIHQTLALRGVERFFSSIPAHIQAVVDDGRCDGRVVIVCRVRHPLY
jgi:hypothetical protein